MRGHGGRIARMAGFNFGMGHEVRGRFVPRASGGEGWDDAQPPRFWQSNGGRQAASDRDVPGGDSVGRAEPDAGRWGDVPVDLIPPGLRPGELPSPGQPGRLMTAAQAAGAYRRNLGRPGGSSASRVSELARNDDVEDNIQLVASADDPRGLKMARAAALAGGLRTDEEFEAFHDAITGKGITSFKELVSVARQIKETGGY